MLMLQNVQFAVPGAAPVRTPPAVETVIAVQGAGEGDRARGDQPRDRGDEAERLTREVKDRVPDPSAPVGPPPSFQANVLESERARLREVEKLDVAEVRRTAAPDVRETSGAVATPVSETREPADLDKGAKVEDMAVRTEIRREAKADASEAREDRAEAREAPASTRSAYGGVKEDPPRMLDLSR